MIYRKVKSKEKTESSLDRREVKLGELILSELNLSCTMDFIPDVKPETIVQEAPTVYIHPKFKPVVPKVKPRKREVTRGTNHLPIHQRLE